MYVHTFILICTRIAPPILLMFHLDYFTIGSAIVVQVELIFPYYLSHHDVPLKPTDPSQLFRGGQTKCSAENDTKERIVYHRERANRRSLIEVGPTEFILDRP